MSDKTLYVSDLDGTLLSNEAKLSAYSTDALNRLIGEGVQFTVATARTAASVTKMLADVKLALPAILMNGALIYDLGEKRSVKIVSISAAAVSAVIAAMRSRGLTGFMYAIEDEALITRYESLESPAIRDFHDERTARFGKPFTKARFEDVSPKGVLYFSFRGEKEELEPLYADLCNVPDLSCVFYKDIYSASWWYAECHGSLASKAHAVRWMRKTYGFARAVGFGDNLNDLPLLEACDEGYAVANARDELKAAATAVIGSNEDDGVARWLAAHATQGDGAFWRALDALAGAQTLVIDRPAGSRHPRYPDFVYPLDYGYLEGTSSMDGGGIDVWRGSDPSARLDAVIVTVDLAKSDSEIKLLVGCSEDEKRIALAVHNGSAQMKGILVRREGSR